MNNTLNIAPEMRKNMLHSGSYNADFKASIQFLLELPF